MYHVSDRNVQTSSPWFTMDMTCQLDVLGYDGDPFHIDGHQVHILKQSHKVGLSCLLQCSHYSNLKAKITLEISGYFPDQMTKWSMVDHQFCTLLVLANLMQYNGAGMEMVWTACRPGKLIHQNANKNVAQALTQLHILIIGYEVMHVMHDMDGLHA